VTVRYFAAARAAAGVPVEVFKVGPGATVDDVLTIARANHGPEFARVLGRCSFLLDEVTVRDRATPLTDRPVLDVLPPFAGG
jgi:molybdopterin synthase sulfur carrier subunit